MNINLETNNSFSIQAYSDSEIHIHSVIYQQNLMVSKQGVISPWSVVDITALTIDSLTDIMAQTPEVIIIGHESTGRFAPYPTLHYLSQHRIGLECMSIGAACRTYNVLLSEYRHVVLGIIFKKPTHPTN